MSLNLVFSDLVKLADGLRSKGLTKQADGLEDKIYQLKQAETHLYKAFEEDGQDLLDFAHPDGSPTVSPAQNQMGQVETLDEAQRKVLEIINKKPTGKFSSEIRDLILITAEALDLSLIKSGQEKPEDKTSDLDVDALGNKVTEESSEEKLEDGEISEEDAKIELALGPEKLQKREKINAHIGEVKQSLVETLNVALAKLDANYTTNPAMLLSDRGTAFFIEKTKTPAENLNVLKQASEAFKDYTPESITEYILSTKKIPDFLENFKNYQVGTNITWTKNYLDSDEDIKKLVDFVSELSDEIPLHFSAYRPMYKMEIKPTPTETLCRAKEIAEKKLKYVYLGNVPANNDTFCPNCKSTVVKRTYGVKSSLIGDKCSICNTKIPIKIN